ncbi:MAG: hypothetical protein IJP29_07075 [Lachnospiraceae bacterium]|nr:hypothetical protein [Lachnospiraceae bacterium]
MKESYKSFMEQQQPSQQLLEDAISKTMEFSKEKLERNLQGRNKRVQNRVRWQYGLAIVAVLCLVCVCAWKWNTRITYMDLVQEFTPDENGDYIEKREKEFGEERNLYLKNFDESYLYVFDKDATTEEISVGEGRITVQIGMVELAGNQLLYQIEPQTIHGQEVFLGKTTIDGRVTLLAAFDIGKEHYYLVGENVTEQEMTSYVKDRLKAFE